MYVKGMEGAVKKLLRLISNPHPPSYTCSSQKTRVCNFAAVLLAAPAVGATASAVGASSAAAAAAAAASRHVIPANAFQVVPPGGQPYRLVDRGAWKMEDGRKKERHRGG